MYAEQASMGINRGAGLAYAGGALLFLHMDGNMYRCEYGKPCVILDRLASSYIGTPRDNMAVESDEYVIVGAGYDLVRCTHARKQTHAQHSTIQHGAGYVLVGLPCLADMVIGPCTLTAHCTDAVQHDSIPPLQNNRHQ